MRRIFVAVGFLCVTAAAAVAQHHVAVTPETMKWGPAPPALPAGAQVAVLEGDPAKTGQPFAMQVKLPDGYRVQAHWHPTDEHLVVVKGALLIGLGDKLDEKAFQSLSTGSYARMPAKTNHFAGAKGETTFVVYGVGPFELNYVNPSDDPRKKGPTAQ